MLKLQKAVTGAHEGTALHSQASNTSASALYMLKYPDLTTYLRPGMEHGMTRITAALCVCGRLNLHVSAGQQRDRLRLGLGQYTPGQPANRMQAHLQVCRKALEIRKPSVNAVFAHAISHEGATEEDARAFILDLRAINYAVEDSPSSGATRVHKLLSQEAIGLLVDCLWTQSWKKELPAAIESKKRRLEGQLERRDSNQAPDQQQKMPPINESSIDTDELPVRVPTGECQDTAQNVSGQGKEEPGPHDQVKAA